MVCVNKYCEQPDNRHTPKQHGCCEVAKSGSHLQFRHAERKGRVAVPHPKKDIPISTF